MEKQKYSKRGNLENRVSGRAGPLYHRRALQREWGMLGTGFNTLSLVLQQNAEELEGQKGGEGVGGFPTARQITPGQEDLGKKRNFKVYSSAGAKRAAGPAITPGRAGRRYQGRAGSSSSKRETKMIF